MQIVDLPEDVLVIHYAALAPGFPPLVRLRVPAAIGRLLTSQGQSWLIDSLLSDAPARLALQELLECKVERCCHG
jgi:hypothetical protein